MVLITEKLFYTMLREKFNVNKIDVLNLEWTSKPSRDRMMATLVCNYLRIQGLSVVESSVFDGFDKLNQLNPRLFFITNTIGAPENLDLMRYAKSRGALGVSLISEGNFIGDSNVHQQMIWGWNGQKILNEEIHLQWSERTRHITLKHHPELKDKITVSGGVGFDSYVIGNNTFDKDKQLSAWGKSEFKKIIGVGCWDFGWMYSEDPRYSINKEIYSVQERSRFLKDAIDFDEILTEAALVNPDCLFLVKHHPGTMLGNKGSATLKISTLPNVVIVKNEISIHDCIAISDFWVVYESTTAMEAWLLGKKTCLLNPSGRDFPRDIIVSKGSPEYLNGQQLRCAISEYYATGHLPGFHERDKNRKQIIKQIIQWSDGLNHVRAGNAILDLLESYPEQTIRKETLNQRLIRWKQHFRWILSPYYYRIRRCRNEWANRKNFVHEDLKRFDEDKLKAQLAFYQSRNLSLDELRQIKSI